MLKPLEIIKAMQLPSPVITRKNDIKSLLIEAWPDTMKNEVREL